MPTVKHGVFDEFWQTFSFWSLALIDLLSSRTGLIAGTQSLNNINNNNKKNVYVVTEGNKRIQLRLPVCSSISSAVNPAGRSM